MSILKKEGEQSECAVHFLVTICFPGRLGITRRSRRQDISKGPDAASPTPIYTLGASIGLDGKVQWQVRDVL